MVLTLVEQITNYATHLRYEDLPPEVIQTAKRVIVDSIGCALGGYGSAPEKIARDLADITSSKQPATVMVSGLKTSPELATFANGVMIRFLDYNDGYTSTGESGHPSDSIAAVLTAAEINKRTGKDVIVATVLAYEMFCRICDTVDLKPIGYDHVTVGGMASTAAAAWLFGLNTACNWALLPTMRCIKRASAMCRCGRAVLMPTPRAMRCSRRCWRRVA